MNSSTRPGSLVPARAAPDRHRPLGRLAIPGYQHVGNLLQLGLADLITNLLLPLVELDPQPGRREPRPAPPARSPRAGPQSAGRSTCTGASQSGNAPA